MFCVADRMLFAVIGWNVLCCRSNAVLFISNLHSVEYSSFCMMEKQTVVIADCNRSTSELL